LPRGKKATRRSRNAAIASKPLAGMRSFNVPSGLLAANTKPVRKAKTTKRLKARAPTRLQTARYRMSS
jgi:hypothetical protein